MITYIIDDDIIKENGLDESYTCEYSQALQWENLKEYDTAGKFYKLAEKITNEEAITWRKIASDMDNDECKNVILNLSSFFYKKSQDFHNKFLLAFYRSESSKGNVWAMTKLVTWYMLGKGLPQDFTKGLSLYKQASEKGYSHSMYKLGNCHKYGLGVEKNIERSIEWYERAVKNGSNAAARGLAISYYTGFDVPEDNVKSLNYYIQASENGDSYSMNQVGWYYERGIGVEKSFVEAFKWYERAAKKGYSRDLIILGVFYEQGLKAFPRITLKLSIIIPRHSKKG